MRLFISGSGPLLEESFRAFQERIGQSILEGYGMSETIMLTSNPYNEDQGPRVAVTVARPLPGVDVRIVDDQDNAVAEGAVGDVQVQGRNLSIRYAHMHETASE